MSATMTRPATVREGLAQVRELLAEPARWTRFEPARDDAGQAVSALSAEAYSWCLAFAIDRVFGLNVCDFNATAVAVDDLLDEVAGMQVVIWNDAPGRTHAEVLELLDRAIALATERNL